jgi:hypothetical protein
MHNKGVGYAHNGKLKYKVEGKRFSGDMNTALGNCIIMCGLVWTYAKLLDIPLKLVNNGDDCVAFMEREHLSTFTQHLEPFFLKHGFRMTTEPPCYTMEEIEFCQMHPIRVREGVIMVRNIRTALEKDTMIIPPVPSKRAVQAWLTAISEGGLSAYGDIPVLGSFYRCLLRHGEGVKNKVATSVQMDHSGMRMMTKGLNRTCTTILPLTRDSCYAAWGLTPDQQIAMEHVYDNYTLDLNTPRDISLTNLLNYNPIINELSLPW